MLFSVSLSGFLEGIKEQETLDEVSKLATVAEQLSIRGEGNEIVLEIGIPQQVFVGFGTLPGRESKWPEDAANYCITVNGNSRFYPAAAFFSNPELDGPVSLGPGRHRLLLTTKIEQESGRLFVLITETGAD